MDFEGIQITWLGHASFRINANDRIIYIDPFQLDGGEEADLILITHDHHDHCSPDDVKKIHKEGTMIISGGNCELNVDNIQIKPGEEKEFEGIKIKAVPAYNVGKEFHPKEKNYVGFIVEINGKRIYHAGDTDLIPEMDVIAADIAMLPVGGEYTMDAREAAEATKKINPSIAIPMHYGSIVGELNDAKEFSRLCECEVRILEKE